MKTSRTILCCTLLFTVLASAQEKVGVPPILEGGGHACWGHLWHTDKTLYWKAVFTSCRSPYTVVSHEGQHWLLKVNKSKLCAYELITIDPSESTYYPWNVVGYLHASDLNKSQTDTLGCGMHPVTAAEVPQERRSKGRR